MSLYERMKATMSERVTSENVPNVTRVSPHVTERDESQGIAKAAQNLDFERQPPKVSQTSLACARVQEQEQPFSLSPPIRGDTLAGSVAYDSEILQVTNGTFSPPTSGKFPSGGSQFPQVTNGTFSCDSPAAVAAQTQAAEARKWLGAYLSTPKRIAMAIQEWGGSLDTPTGRPLGALLRARRELGVEAYEGADGKIWWRLSHEPVQ